MQILTPNSRSIVNSPRRFAARLDSELLHFGVKRAVGQPKRFGGVGLAADFPTGRFKRTCDVKTLHICQRQRFRLDAAHTLKSPSHVGFAVFQDSKPQWAYRGTLTVLATQRRGKLQKTTDQQATDIDHHQAISTS